MKKAVTGGYSQSVLEFDFVSTDVFPRLTNEPPMPAEIFTQLELELRLVRATVLNDADELAELSPAELEELAARMESASPDQCYPVDMTTNAGRAYARHCQVVSRRALSGDGSQNTEGC
jgi:hypothetical protein